MSQCVLGNRADLSGLNERKMHARDAVQSQTNSSEDTQMQRKLYSLLSSALIPASTGGQSSHKYTSDKMPLGYLQSHPTP